MKKKLLYPHAEDIKRGADMPRVSASINDEPDFIGGAPNYDKFKGWSPEQVLIWLNID